MRLSLTKQLLKSLSLVLLSAVLPASAAPGRSASNVERRATVCNGHAELCEKSFGSVTFVGAHDSYAIGNSNGNFAVNQDQSITTQLNDGVRMLQMQAHNQNGEIKLCHTDCSLYDGGTLHDYLATVGDWLNANPNEVLALLIVNIDNVPVAQYDPIFKAVGLDVHSFVPSSVPIPAASWPTLGSMIDSGQRLVTFMDNKADGSVPYILDEFTHIWETAFDVTDPAFDCNINRTSSNVDPAGTMYLINHFLDKTVLGNPVPFVEKLNVTNAASGDGSLGAQVDTCMAQHSKPPNFMLVDFYEFGGGSVFEVAARINNVQFDPSHPVASPVPSGASPSSTAQTTSRPLNSNALSDFGVFSYKMVLPLFSAITGAVLGPYLLFL
ncbi:hypothetical protein D9756_006018 [Leucocoprinus leucothites]|uniref:PLC-like phosphodiesterase n=1 Tax=Leucocoprinus leucothites TaxID=201217 RepID=A0A8H5FX68_9AGAR|nr:hypothetical protein D9756_006018 [Leucoagaricus leucothites]